MIIYDNNDNYHMLIIMIIMNNYNRTILLIGIMILRSVSQPTRQRALLTLLVARRLASTARLHPLARPYGRGWGGSAAATRSPTRSATTGTCGSKAAILGMWPFEDQMIRGMSNVALLPHEEHDADFALCIRGMANVAYYDADFAY